MKVGIIGSGGREHALCMSLKKSEKISKIYCIPGNAGTNFIAENIDLNLNDFELIKRYREVAQHPECDMAVEDIINEVIISNERDAAVSVSLDKLAISENIKTKIAKDINLMLNS